MSEDVKVRLEARKKALETEFAKLEAERNKGVSQRAQLDQRLSQIQARQLQLQGSFQEVAILLDPPKPVPVEESTEKEK